MVKKSSVDFDLEYSPILLGLLVAAHPLPELSEEVIGRFYHEMGHPVLQTHVQGKKVYTLLKQKNLYKAKTEEEILKTEN